jgi:hypothetical protein
MLISWRLAAGRERTAYQKQYRSSRVLKTTRKSRRFAGRIILPNRTHFLSCTAFAIHKSIKLRGFSTLT